MVWALTSIKLTLMPPGGIIRSEHASFGKGQRALLHNHGQKSDETLHLPLSAGFSTILIFPIAGQARNSILAMLHERPQVNQKSGLPLI